MKVVEHRRLFYRASLSVSSNGSCAVKVIDAGDQCQRDELSVSSNGSCAVKGIPLLPVVRVGRLSVSSNGSCAVKVGRPCSAALAFTTFSILERIVCGEGLPTVYPLASDKRFQYPRTDRVR